MRNYVHTIDPIKIEQRSIKFSMYNTYDYLYNYKINYIKNYIVVLNTLRFHHYLHFKC